MLRNIYGYKLRIFGRTQHLLHAQNGGGNSEILYFRRAQ